MTAYNTIGQGYNQTRKADPFITQALYNLLTSKPNGTYFDVGCGTGNYTVALADKGVNLYGIDPSSIMLEQAKAKSNKVQWVLGNAESLPFDDNHFDGGMATLTLHHWDSIEKGFTEIRRVLKPNAQLVVFAAISDLTEQFWLKHYFPKMLEASVKKEPKLSIIEDAAKASGLNIITKEKYFVQDDLQDQFLYVGKNNPQLYFNETVRNGISSFVQLSLQEEVEQGLLQLKTDVDSGEFKAVQKQYENDLGDYMFIVLSK